MISCIEPIQSLNKTDVKRGLGILILVLFFCPLCKGLNAYIWGCFALYRYGCPIGRESLKNYFQVDSERFSLAVQVFTMWVVRFLIQGDSLHFRRSDRFVFWSDVFRSHSTTDFARTPNQGYLKPEKRINFSDRLIGDSSTH